MGQVQVLRLTVRHEAIMTWMLMNPELALSECAAHFGVTQAWLSTLIHSNCFQARLHELQERLFSGVTSDLKEKLTAAAHLSLERLLQRIEVSTDESFILNAADRTLKNLGYGAPRSAPSATIHNTVVLTNAVDRETLANARKLIDKGPAEVVEPLRLEEKAAEKSA